MIWSVVCALLLLNTENIQSAKILGVFSFPSISHQVVFRKITEELLKRGHEVTVITPDPAYHRNETPANLIEIDVHDVSYNAKNDFFANHAIIGNQDLSHITRISKILKKKIFESQLNTTEVQNFLLKNTNEYDLILIEPMVRPSLIVSHYFKAPVILVSSLGVTFGDNNVIGSPSHPILFPQHFNKQIYNLTLWQKVEKFYHYFKIEYEDLEMQNGEHEMLQKYLGPDVPSINELCNNVDMLFLNVHPIWAENQPVPPNVVYLGGIHRKETKDLPMDLQAYLDSSKHGVIYVSFGTNALARFIPENLVEGMVRVLSTMPHDILWKWDEDRLPLQSENIKTSKWFPQADLLRHKNVKLFIFQGGLQSTDEAIVAGVPLVAVPMLGDQAFNADKYVRHGIGKKVPLENFSEELFRQAIEMVLIDNSYYQNVIKLRNLLLDQPESPVDRAMWWIHYVLRNGGAKHLRAPTANISWMDYIEIEVILIVAFILVLTLTTVILAFVFSYKFILDNFSLKSNKKLKKK